MPQFREVEVCGYWGYWTTMPKIKHSQAIPDTLLLQYPQYKVKPNQDSVFFKNWLTDCVFKSQEPGNKLWIGAGAILNYAYKSALCIQVSIVHASPTDWMYKLLIETSL